MLMDVNEKEIVSQLEVDFPTAEQLENELKKTKNRSEFFRLLRSTLYSLIVVAAVAVLISVMFLPVLKVTGTSMTPTCHNDDLIVCRKYASFERGDVIAFYYNNRILLKRVIAVSGDTVNIEADGTVYINNERLDEPYVNELAFGECNIQMPYQVPDERIFVMGDHRATSIDSRSTKVGCISEESVVGKVFFRVAPFKRFGAVK